MREYGAFSTHYGQTDPDLLRGVGCRRIGLHSSEIRGYSIREGSELCTTANEKRVEGMDALEVLTWRLLAATTSTPHLRHDVRLFESLFEIRESREAHLQVRK